MAPRPDRFVRTRTHTHQQQASRSGPRREGHSTHPSNRARAVRGAPTARPQRTGAAAFASRSVCGCAGGRAVPPGRGGSGGARTMVWKKLSRLDGLVGLQPYGCFPMAASLWLLPYGCFPMTASPWLQPDAAATRRGCNPTLLLPDGAAPVNGEKNRIGVDEPECAYPGLPSCRLPSPSTTCPADRPPAAPGGRGGPSGRGADAAASSVGGCRAAVSTPHEKPGH